MLRVVHRVRWETAAGIINRRADCRWRGTPACVRSRSHGRIDGKKWRRVRLRRVREGARVARGLGGEESEVPVRDGDGVPGGAGGGGGGVGWRGGRGGDGG